MNDDEKLLKKIQEDLKRPTLPQTYEVQQFNRFLRQQSAIQRKMDRESAIYDAIGDEKLLKIQNLEREIAELQISLSQVSKYSSAAEEIRENINQKTREIKKIRASLNDC